MQVITLGNIKGGVSKSTVTRELSHRLAQKHRVLMIDFDPKPTLTRSSNIPTPPPYTLGEALIEGKSIKPSITKLTDSLFIATTDRSLNTVETELRNQGQQGIKALANALKEVQRDFDYIVIDPEGKAGMLITNALVASTALIIPIKPTADDLDDLPDFLELMQDTQPLRPKPLTKIAILPTQVVTNSSLHKEAIEALEFYKYKMLPSIGHTTQASGARFKKILLSIWSKDNPRVAEYDQLAKEVILWLTKN